jgi:transcriptional regulator with PAS, ATPase and Fis domain
LIAIHAFSPKKHSLGKEQSELLLDLWEAVVHAEQEAEKQLGLLQEQTAIIEHITDGLLVVDRDLMVKHMNAAAGRILNLNPGTSIGRSFSSLLDFQPIIKPILETGEGYVDRELIITSPMRHLHLIDSAIPIKDAAGKVVSIVNSFREIQRARRIADKLSGNHARYTFESVVGNSSPLAKAVEAARKAARGFANVLLSGPSGVGKEVFAQSIHNASTRADGPFIAINCAALPRDLIESELFGYAPGSFTGAHREGRPGKFEAASGGTIFLDEISELPIDVQAKLLRVLQEREVVRVGETKGIPIDVRVISASNRDLAQLIQAKEFREDLYYRCHVIGIDLPALVERPEDISVLAYHFLRKYSQLLEKRIFAIEEDALAALVAYEWPGNVRELENLIERLVNMVDGEAITLEDLPKTITKPRLVVSLEGKDQIIADEAIRPLVDIERDALVKALRICQFNVTEAARRLGVAKPTMYAKIKAYGIAMERTTRRATPAR